MARKRKRRKARRRKKASSVGKRAHKYYLSVKRNKKYRRKRRKRGPGKQLTIFGPRKRRKGYMRKSRHGRRTGSMGQTQGAGAWTSAHNKIV